MNGGAQVAEVLKRHGVPFVFTLCGGHISPILVACKALGIRVVDVRHEATAVFAADAVARLTGAPGVAIVTAGPGVTNTLTAVENARLAQSPLVLIGGATATILRGRGALQDIDQAAIMRPHVKRVYGVKTVAALGPAVAAALAEAASGVPGPVFVECPIDLLYDEALVRSWYTSGSPATLAGKVRDWFVTRHVNGLFASATPVAPSQTFPHASPPSRGKVERGKAMLRAAEKPVLVVGSQAVQSPVTAQALVAALSRLEVPVYLSGMARGLLGKGADFHYRHGRKLALKEADLVILAGVPADFRLNYGRHINSGAKLISVNLHRGDLTRNRFPDLAIHGDPGGFLSHLADALDGPCSACPQWRAHLRRRDRSRDLEITKEAAVQYGATNPLRLAQEIDTLLGESSIVVGDGGDFVAGASYVIQPRAPLQWLDPGVFGTLGVGAGFALGAKLVHPEADVWLLYGDGAAGYSIVEFDTLVRHGVPVVGVVGNDACWSQIARDQLEILGDGVATELSKTRYDQVAVAFGAAGFQVKEDGAISGALTAALTAARSGQPALVNAHIARTDFRKGSISM